VDETGRERRLQKREIRAGLRPDKEDGKNQGGVTARWLPEKD